MKQDQKQVDALDALINDEQELKALEGKIDVGVNFFKISNMESSEIRHSRVLSWFLDPNGNHGFKEAVLKAVLEKLKVSDIDKIKFDTFVVKNEWNNIDILLISEVSKKVIVIENKIYATERIDGADGGQLKKYRDIINAEYPSPEYECKFVYLTLKPDSPSDPVNWITFSYEYLIGIVEKETKLSGLDDDVRIIIKHYINIIRRNILMEDVDFQKECKTFYDKHKEIIEIINDIVPKTWQEVSAFIGEELRRIAKERKSLGIPTLVFDENSDALSSRRFITKRLAGQFPGDPNETPYYSKVKWSFMYEIALCDPKPGKDAAPRLFGIVFAPDNDICKKMYEFGNPKGGNKFKLQLWTHVCSFGSLVDKGIYTEWAKDITKAKAKITESIIKKLDKIDEYEDKLFAHYGW